MPDTGLKKEKNKKSCKPQAPSYKRQAASFKHQATSFPHPRRGWGKSYLRHIVAVTKCLLTQDMGCDVMSH